MSKALQRDFVQNRWSKDDTVEQKPQGHVSARHAVADNSRDMTLSMSGQPSPVSVLLWHCAFLSLLLLVQGYFSYLVKAVGLATR